MTISCGKGGISKELWIALEDIDIDGDDRARTSPSLRLEALDRDFLIEFLVLRIPPSRCCDGEGLLALELVTDNGRFLELNRKGTGKGGP